MVSLPHGTHLSLAACKQSERQTSATSASPSPCAVRPTSAECPSETGSHRDSSTSHHAVASNGIPLSNWLESGLPDAKHFLLRF